LHSNTVCFTDMVRVAIFMLPFVVDAGVCTDPTSACTGVCAPCKGTCETLKSSFCAQCWAVDPTLGTSCLSDTADNDCRDCWHGPTPAPAPSPPSPPTPPTPPTPSSGKFTCQGIPHVSGQCVDDPSGFYDASTCAIACGGATPPSPPAPPPAPRPNPFSKECKSMLEADCGKFTPHGEKTNSGTCNWCISDHAHDIVPLCGGWQPQDGGQIDFQNWCLDQYVPPVPTPPPTPVPSPTPSPSPSPFVPGGCNDPTNACENECETCQGTCETLQTGACAPCWAVDPDKGHACLSDSEGEHGDCRNCWYPTPSPAPVPSPSPSGCPGGSLAACMVLCPTSPSAVYTACVTNCGEKCVDPSPSPDPVPVPVPVPTPSPVPTPTGGCQDPTGACTGVCAPCKGTCETLKTSFCAQCWAVDPTLGTSCLSDASDNDCRDCWHPTFQLV